MTPRSLWFAAALSGAACIIPPAPATLPASGVPGQPRASMKSARTKGESPFKDAYFELDPESNAHSTAQKRRSSRPTDAAAKDMFVGLLAAAWSGIWCYPGDGAGMRLVWAKTGAGGLPVMIIFYLPY